MKIAFLIDSPGISGGAHVIFRHALFLKEQGQDVYCISSKHLIPGILDWFPEAKKLKWLKSKHKKIEFDIVIATFWTTCFDLARYKADSYCYLVQSIEDKFYEKDSADAHQAKLTYDLPLNIITIASWIQAYLEKNHNKKAELCLNGIDKEFFNTIGPIEIPKSGTFRILVEGPLGVPFKNTEFALECANSVKNAEVVLLTSTNIKTHPLAKHTYSRIKLNQTPDIYRSCDVILKLSTVEGMFGPPLEMFHCGGTAVVYAVTGHDEYIKNGSNAIVLDELNKEVIVNVLSELIENKAKLDRLKVSSIKTSHEWPSWAQSNDQFFRCLIASKEKLSHSDQIDSLRKFADTYYGSELSQFFFGRNIRNFFYSRPLLYKYAYLFYKPLKRLLKMVRGKSRSMEPKI